MKLIAALSVAVLVCLSTAGFAKAKPHRAAPSLKQQIAQRDRVIADLRSQVQYLTAEIAHMKETGGGFTQSAVPAVPTMTVDQQGAILTEERDTERIVNRRYVEIHGNPPDGNPNKRNLHSDRIILLDTMLMDLYQRAQAGLPMRTYTIPPPVPGD